MSDLWTVVGAVAGVVGIVTAAFVAGVKRGTAKTKQIKQITVTRYYLPKYSSAAFPVPRILGGPRRAGRRRRFICFPKDRSSSSLIDGRPTVWALASVVVGVPSVDFSDGPGQTILGTGHENQMHMIRHDAIGPNFDAVGYAVLGKQVTVELVVVFLNEDLLAAITPLRDMVGNTGNGNSVPESLAMVGTYTNR